MKRVSFYAAKALKEAGYPQMDDYTYDLETETLSEGFISQNRCEAPTYLEVWLWLWREKKLSLEVFFYLERNKWYVLFDNNQEMPLKDDPEEAIIAAIEYLVENDLIK